MIVVLGGGPAGRMASNRLATAGKEVTLVEPGGRMSGIGGQCLHFGCMPVCALNDVARIISTVQRLHSLGITEDPPNLNFPALMDGMSAVQQKIAGILDDETRNSGVNIIYEKAGKVEGRKIFIGDDPVDAEAAIIATGSIPIIPDIPGMSIAGVYSPRSIWNMRELPQKLVIIGGNIMAAEFAYIFQSFGCEVTVLARSTFLKNLDPHLRSVAVKELSATKITENSEVTAIRGMSSVTGVTYHIEKNEREVPADTVLIATGLTPNSGMVTGLAKGPAGEIVVNDRMETSVPGTYACGDVTGPPYLTPVARHEGIVAADNILGKDRHMDYSRIPQALFLGHEIAFCGCRTEGSASLAMPGPAGPGTFWSVPFGDTGLAKIFANPESGAISGICAAGPAGGTIAAYLAFLMQRDISVHDFEDFIEVHPSTDGIYGLSKYTSEILRKNRK